MTIKFFFSEIQQQTIYHVDRHDILYEMLIGPSLQCMVKTQWDSLGDIYHSENSCNKEKMIYC